jgi:hypothetical protein
VELAVAICSLVVSTISLVGCVVLAIIARKNANRAQQIAEELDRDSQAW